jgi:hypothetical protein
LSDGNAWKSKLSRLLTAGNLASLTSARNSRCAGNAPTTTKKPSCRFSRRRHRLAAEPLECGKVAIQTLADRLIMTAQAIVHAAAATFQQVDVERFEAVEHRDRHQEVASRKADKPLDFTLVIGPARPAEAVLEQVVRLEFRKDPCSLPFAVSQDPRDGNLGVVIKNRLGHATEKRERLHMALAERLGRFRRIGHHEGGVRVRQVESKKVDLALHAADDAEGLAKINLGMTRRVCERHEHLLRGLPPARHVILYNRDAPGEAILVPQPLKDPLRCMLLFVGSAFILFENAVDDRNKRAQLWPSWRFRPPIARRDRELQHLRDRSRVDPKSPRRRPLA